MYSTIEIYFTLCRVIEYQCILVIEIIFDARFYEYIVILIRRMKIKLKEEMSYTSKFIRNKRFKIPFFKNIIFLSV